MIETGAQKLEYILGENLFKTWLYVGMIIGGVGLAFLKGWSIAFAFLIIVYILFGFFLYSNAKLWSKLSAEQNLSDFLTQLFTNC